MRAKERRERERKDGRQSEWGKESKGEMREI